MAALEYSGLEKYPFFKLVNTRQQAEIALSAMVCFGNEKERNLFSPEVARIQQEFEDSAGHSNLVSEANNLLVNYLDNNGEISDSLLIFLSKGIEQNEAA